MQVDPQWWRSLKSPKLDALIETAPTASPSLTAARATLRQAQELHAAQAGSTLYPQVDAGLGAQRRAEPKRLGQAGMRGHSAFTTPVSACATTSISPAATAARWRPWPPAWTSGALNWKLRA